MNPFVLKNMEFSCGPNSVESGGNRIEDQYVLEKNRNIEEIEMEFCDMYYEASKKLFDIDDGNNLLYLRRYFRIFLPLVNTWCAFSNPTEVDNNFRRLLTSILYFRLTYIYRNCVVLSSVVAFHFQNVLMDNPLICQKLQQKKSIKICSLGSGSASEIVGIVQVLETVAVIMNIELEVFVTIIDSDVGWKNTAMVVLSGLKQFRGAVWKITFIEADLSHDFSPTTLKAMQNADILTMVNFVSEFTSTSLPNRQVSRLQKTFKNITETILPGSMLFVLDVSREDIIRRCGGHTGQIPKFDLIYEELCDLYTLQMSTVEKLFVQYHRTFPKLGCNTFLKTFARVWIRRLPDERNQLPLDRESQKNRFLITRVHKNSLTRDFLQNWEHRFCHEMAKLGWNRRGINKVISGQHEKRSMLLKRHFEMKRLVEDAREKLIEQRKDINETAWEEYYKAKTDLSFVEHQVYSLMLYNMKCNQKRNALGTKKH